MYLWTIPKLCVAMWEPQNFLSGRGLGKDLVQIPHYADKETKKYFPRTRNLFSLHYNSTRTNEYENEMRHRGDGPSVGSAVCVSFSATWKLGGLCAVLFCTASDPNWKSYVFHGKYIFWKFSVIWDNFMSFWSQLSSQSLSFPCTQQTNLKCFWNYLNLDSKLFQAFYL